MGGTINRTILVSGMGRCGSSMMMQMLAATGLRCLGKPPLYEVDMVPGDPAPVGLWGKYDAAKFLMPSMFDFPAMPGAAFIWIDRDLNEQSRSLRKLSARAVAGQRPDTPAVLATHVRYLESERAKCVQQIRGYPRIEVTFEHLLADPREAAEHIAEFLASLGVRVNPEAMASVVVRRSPECAPDLAMELGGMEVASGFAH